MMNMMMKKGKMGGDDEMKQDSTANKDLAVTIKCYDSQLLYHNKIYKQ